MKRCQDISLYYFGITVLKLFIENKNLIENTDFTEVGVIGFLLEYVYYLNSKYKSKATVKNGRKRKFLKSSKCYRIGLFCMSIWR